METWVTDSDLVEAQTHFALLIPGFKLPAAYSVARIGQTEGQRFAERRHFWNQRGETTLVGTLCGRSITSRCASAVTASTS